MTKFEAFAEVVDFARNWQDGSYRVADFLEATSQSEWAVPHEDNLVLAVMREYAERGSPDGYTREDVIRYFARVDL